MAITQSPKIGHIDHADTKVCAVTGKTATSGMIRYSLRDGWYFRIHPSAQSKVDEAFIASIMALVPSEKTKKEEAK